jgi:hypothetical protein
VASVNNSLVYYVALKKAGGSVEMHLFAEGKHAFGAASHELSDNAMASVSGDLAADDRDDFGVAALGTNKLTNKLKHVLRGADRGGGINRQHPGGCAPGGGEADE